MVITNPGELRTSWILYSGRKLRGWRIWLRFSKGPSQARINSSSLLGWLHPELLFSFQGSDLAFWVALPTFSSNSCTHTPWEQSRSDFALAALACIRWQKVTVKFRSDHLTGRSWETGWLRRAIDTRVELAAYTPKEGSSWWLRCKLNWEGGIISKPKHKETGS